jgi:hypothetical protein
VASTMLSVLQTSRSVKSSASSLFGVAGVIDVCEDALFSEHGHHRGLSKFHLVHRQPSPYLLVSLQQHLVLYIHRSILASILIVHARRKDCC